MKKLKNSFMAVIIIFLMISCSKEKTFEKNYEVEKKESLTIINNKNVPGDPGFTLNFVEEAAINFAGGNNSAERDFAGTFAICGDDEGNYYFADFLSSKILKFSNDFKFINSFGFKGTGQGEFVAGPVNVSYSSGRIIASGIWNLKTIVFNTRGEFIKILPQSIWCSFSHSLIGFNNNVIMNNVTRRFEGSDQAVSSAVILLDPDLEKIDRTFYIHDGRSRNRVLPLGDMNIRFAAGEKCLYIADVSIDRYTVDVYNKKFEKVMEIRKRYIPEAVVDPEARFYLFEPNSLGGSKGGSLQAKKNTPWRKNRESYYKSVHGLMVDNKERLWVVTPEKNINSHSGLYVDVFEKGIFLNKVRLPFFKGNVFSSAWISVFLVNDKLLYVDQEDKVIRVYSY